MCLESITKRNVILEKDTIAWKVCRRDANNQLTSQYSHSGYTLFKPHRLNNGPHKTQTIGVLDSHQRYPSGYHCITTRNEARRWKFIMGPAQRADVIKKVIITKGTKITLGIQSGYEVIVTPKFRFA